MTAYKALIVDDDRFIRGIVDRTLCAAGFATAQAENGEQALELIEGFDPELVVLDIWMPGRYDGVQVCRIIRANPRFANTVVVMITASDHRKVADRCLEAGANMLIPKPFSPKGFMEQVKALIEDHRRKT